MACERYREALTELAAGAPASVGLDAHLAACEGCRQELDTLRRALAAVDADLQQLVATEPSPELAVRIRRAAAEPLAAPAWRPGVILQALAAAAVLVAALVVMRGRAPAPQPAAAVATRVPLASSATPLPGPTAAPVVAAATPLPVAVPPQPHASRRPLTRPEPVVLVPPGEAEALLRLVALLNRDRVAPPMLGAAGQPSAELAELRSVNVGPIDIQPLEIVPLDPAEASGT